MNTKEGRDSYKKLYLEILRIISLIGVIYCHTGKRGLLLHEVTTNPGVYYFSKTMLLFSQICVPVFFMISGTLLLSKKESLYHHLRHRVLRFVLILFVVVTLQYVYNRFENPALYLWYPNAGFEHLPHPFSLHELLGAIHSSGSLTQHWILYANISFLLLLPFLQKMVQNMSKEHFIFIILLFLIHGVVFPFWERWQHFDQSSLEFPMLTNIIFYPMLGYFVDRLEFFKKKKTVAALLLFSLVLTILNLILMKRDFSLFDESNIFVYSTTLFCLVAFLFQNECQGKPIRSILLFCGKGVFGTYLLEHVLRAFCEPVYMFFIQFGELPALFTWMFCVALLGILLVNLMRKIPILGLLFGEGFHKRQK